MAGRIYVARALKGIFGVCAVLAVAVAPALGQQPRPDYRSLQPRQLITAWKTAAREDRAALAAEMITRRAEVLPALRQSVQSGDREEKMFACSAIAEMRDHDSVDTLLAATSDADVKVRRRALTVIRILADGRSAPRLRELLRSEADHGALKTAIAALGRVGKASDIALIAPFLTHADFGVQVVAAAALAMLGDQRGIDLVIQATHSDDPGVQKSATYALGFFTAPSAAQRLQAIIADPNGAWKAYALVALGERRLATQSTAEQISTLDSLAHGHSRVLSEWAVDRLTDIGGPDAAAVLRGVRDRKTPVGAKAARRLQLLEAQP
jgi:HEAT repeat protein